MSANGKAPSVRAAPGGLTANAHLIGIQRTRILAAMVDVCAERSASDVTVARVVQRAGVSRRTFYEIFAGREDCFLAAFDEGVARAREYVLAVHDPRAKWVERIRAAVVALLQFLDAERRIGELMLLGSLSVGAGALQRRQAVLDELVAAVEKGREEAKRGAELPPLTAEGIVGGALAILHSRLAGGGEAPMVDLAGPLTSMIVLPYRGTAVAQRELRRPVPVSEHDRTADSGPADPLRDLEIRLTYRTVRVLLAVEQMPGASNREIGDAAGIADQGQISKLLARLYRLGLVQNTWATPAKGAPNSWALTERGHRVARAMGGEANPRVATTGARSGGVAP